MSEFSIIQELLAKCKQKDEEYERVYDTVRPLLHKIQDDKTLLKNSIIYHIYSVMRVCGIESISTSELCDNYDDVFWLSTMRDQMYDTNYIYRFFIEGGVLKYEDAEDYIGECSGLSYDILELFADYIIKYLRNKDIEL